MHLISASDIADMETRYRAALINSLGGFKSVVLIGSQNTEGQQNLAIFNSIVHLGANPPLVGMIFRPDSVERHTLENILETGVYTINHLHEGIYEQAHQTSARYPREQSEFEATGLTALARAAHKAPFVTESRVQIAMQYREKHDLAINGTILLIGQITGIWLSDTGAIQPDGFIDLEALGTLTCSGLDSYHSTQRLARLSYAKAGQPPTHI
jgi:flavin reductase (DIM6/NTAB) family NADH-FMN oxidoreductase RutF